MTIKFQFTAISVILPLLVGCEPIVDVRGNLPSKDLLQDIEVGYIKKSEVVDLLGSPSSVSPFESDTWFYISERTETVAFFEPEIKERKVLVIKFDGKA